MKKLRHIIVLGLNERDYHYANVKSFREDGSCIYLECELVEGNGTFVARHFKKNISGIGEIILNSKK